MIKYPSIEQFRNVIRKVKETHDYQGKDELGNAVYAHLTPYPTLEFKGTIKLHGTNASVVKYKDKDLVFQSRERELTIQADNTQFMMNMLNKQLDFLFEGVEFNEYVAVYGEWCGGNVQKGVAINGLPKMFVIFGYLVDGVWMDKIVYDNAQNIYHIEQFPTYKIDIDFNNPELSQNKLIELTLAVEEKCPVGEYFGNIGIGEGIVFSAVGNPNLRFKSKGEKHSVSTVKKLNSIDVESLENVLEFVKTTVTENRLNQGVQYLKEMQLSVDVKSTGEFLRWVVNDINKEEIDTIVKNQFDIKKVNNSVSKFAREWFMQNIA